MLQEQHRLSAQAGQLDPDERISTSIPFSKAIQYYL
jgi:hypothetical protein